MTTIPEDKELSFDSSFSYLPEMADQNYLQPSLRRSSPSPSTSPTPAIGACPELSRCVSTASSVVSTFSDRSSSIPRESLGSMSSTSRQSSASTISRQSSGSYAPRQSMGGVERPKRRGYVRPQGTYFAASAQSRESVMNLGSIAHLQYYFARTGLLDGKGGRLAKKKDLNGPMDLSNLDIGSNTSFLSPLNTTGNRLSFSGSEAGNDSVMVESPINEHGEEDEYFSGEEEEDPDMLPPTVSTYNKRPKQVPRPPTLEELKTDLTSTLTSASEVLTQVKNSIGSEPSSPQRRSESDARPPDSPSASQNQGWYELQGMHILDVTTLAIRAAKRYYTAHDQPQRLVQIKSERKIRAELLGVMDVLKRMATRNFAHGMRKEEREVMENWIAGVWDMLGQEEAMEAQEKEERAAWAWMDDGIWNGEEINEDGICVQREYAFLKSMTPTGSPNLIEYAASQYPESVPPEISPFLLSLASGLQLVRLHNNIVAKSKRQFGSIPVFHVDTAKPYRCAENLRFWVKAAELRWEIKLQVDVMGVVNAVQLLGGAVGEKRNSQGLDGRLTIEGLALAMRGFERAVWKWAKGVREEVTGDLK